MPDFGNCALIVPCFNAEKYLDECLTSIRNQTYKNLLIYVVNDGSTDQTQRIIELHASTDHRIIPMRTPRQSGVSVARNLALKNIYTSGVADFVGFVDSDDLLSPAFVSTSLELLTKEPKADFATVGLTTFNKLGCHVKKLDKQIVEVLISGSENILGNYFSGLLREYKNKSLEDSVCLGLANKIFRVRALQGIFFRGDLKNAEDQDFFIRLADKLTYAIITTKILYFYRQRRGSLSHSVCNGRLKELELYLDVLKKTQKIWVRNLLSRVILESWWRAVNDSVNSDGSYSLYRGLTTTVFAAVERKEITPRDLKRMIIFKSGFKIFSFIVGFKRNGAIRECMDLYFD